MNKFIIFISLLLFASSALAKPALPLEAFASLPDVKQLSLSPNGRYVLFLKRGHEEGMRGTLVSIYDTEKGTLEVPIHADNEKYLISWVRWANNEQFLLGTRFPDKRWRIGTMESRLLKFDLKTRKLENVYKSSFLRRLKYYPQFQDQIVDMLPEDDKHILVKFASNEPQSTKVLRVNLESGRVKTEQKVEKNVIDWMTDRQHRVRVAVELKDTTYKVLVRKDPNKSDWSQLWEYESLSADRISPMGFDADPNILYVRAYHQDKLAIFKVDLSRFPEQPKELVFSDPDYDVDGSLLYSKKAKKVIGTTYSNDSGFTFWDKKYLALQNGVNKAIPEKDNTIVSFSKEEDKYLLRSTSDIDAGTFFLGDRQAKSLIPVAHSYKNLLPEMMSEKKHISYKARDGLDIEAYLTLPKSSGNKPYPTIIHPHGGPIGRNNSGFDYWTQFFASRGYAVLQMNFRGSHGYGYNFMAAGLQAWGKEMQTDVEDGTRWMIEQRYADPDRICMVGASYGGYAALMEAAKNSDLYQCAVSFAGVSDVFYLMRSYARFTNYELVKKQIGKDRKQLRANSPVTLAEQIDIPILLVHGNEDRIVKVEHSRKMQKALRKANKEVSYIEQEDGNHFLSNEEHRLSFFKAMDAFLNEHLNPMDTSDNASRLGIN